MSNSHQINGWTSNWVTKKVLSLLRSKNCQRGGCVYFLFSLLEPLVPCERIRWGDLDLHRLNSFPAILQGALLSHSRCNSACLCCMGDCLRIPMIDLFIYLITSYLSLSIAVSLSFTCFGPWLLFSFFFPHCFCHRYCWELLAAAFQSCAIVCHSAEVQKKHLLLMLSPSCCLTVSHPFFKLLFIFCYL